MDRANIPRDRRTSRLGIIGGVVLVVLVGELLLLPLGDALARWSYDVPFPWRRNIPDEVVMVYLDPKIKSNLGQPADEPLDRSFYVQLVDRLTGGGARLVLFDIIFDAPSADPAIDAKFAEAMRQHGRVVLIGYLVKQFQGNHATSVAITAPMPPTPVLAEAAAGWGLAEISPDPADNCVRLLDTGSEDFPSASWVAAAMLNAPVTSRPEARREQRWLNYYCEPLLLKAVDLDKALQKDQLQGDFFRNKIVVVGSRPGGGGIAGAERELFKTPFTRYDTASGPSIHALSLLNLLRGDWLTRLTFAQQSVIVLIWGILVGLGLPRFRPWTAVLVSVALFCIFAAVSVWIQMRYQVWFVWLLPFAVQTSVALVWSVGFRYLVETRRRRKIQHALAVYLSPHMAERVANSDFDLSLGGKEVHATIMFTDLEGFTAMTERMPPSEVSRILISYFTETTRAILEKDGTIIKYMGDAVLAEWGALVPNPRSAQTAVEAALEMRKAGEKEIASRHFRTRIGINSGLVLAGNLGSEFRFDYAAIGETTNVASRLESMNKYLGTDILITEATRRELDGEFVVRPLGHFIVAGTTRPLGVFEVIGVSAEFHPSLSWLQQFGTGLEHFKRGEFDAAEASFQKVSELRGAPDGPSAFYLKQITDQRAKPATDSPWDGVIRFESK